MLLPCIMNPRSEPKRFQYSPIHILRMRYHLTVSHLANRSFSIQHYKFQTIGWIEARRYNLAKLSCSVIVLDAAVSETNSQPCDLIAKHWDPLIHRIMRLHKLRTSLDFVLPQSVAVAFPLSVKSLSSGAGLPLSFLEVFKPATFYLNLDMKKRALAILC